MNYDIQPLETEKKHVPLRASMKSGVIEKYPCSTIISGRSGSGKTCLVTNLLSRKEFYGGYYHQIVLISPTAGTLDDAYQGLKIPKENIFNEFSPETLEQILAGRKMEIEQHGIKYVCQNSRVLIILDDIIASQEFLRSKVSLVLFAMLRHYLCSVMVLTQSYNKIPRPLRLQANGVYVFPASRSEINVVLDEITPADKTKKEFEQILIKATSEPHSFLHINNTAEKGKKVRKNMCQEYY